MSDRHLGVTVILSIVVLAFVVGFVLGLRAGAKATRQEAVDMGHAQWTVSSTGEPIWMWKTNGVEVGK